MRQCHPPAGPNSGWARARLTPSGEAEWTVMLLGLFLRSFLAFVVAVVLFEWLVDRVGGVWIAVAVIATMGAFIAAVALLVPAADGLLGGVIIAVGVILFWSFAIFDAAGATRIFVLVLSGALLFAGVLAAIARLLERGPDATN